MADKNVRYLNPINIETSKEKYCRFKKNGIKLLNSYKIESKSKMINKKKN